MTNWLRFWKRKPKHPLGDEKFMGIDEVTKPEWSDPLDPHGDGTLRPGDPVYDAMMRGNVVYGNFGKKGWEFTESSQDDEGA